LGQFTADETGKGQFFRGDLRNLAGEEVVRKIWSPQRVASVSNLCNFAIVGSGVARVPCALGQKIFLRPPSTKFTEFKLKNRCKNVEEAKAEHLL